MADQAATAVSVYQQTHGRLNHFAAELFLVVGTINLASIATGATGTDTGTITAPGVALGDIVLGVSCSVDVAGITLNADVTAANTIKVRGMNLSGGAVDLASATFRVLVARAIV
jgi:hypothetical protein